ncbi:MAG TPA: hypothetical protein VFN37_12720 [Candidatus Baltobacteraceae bacterium]|nr:hypothetical protein [Candidatus Baltobacteraceae bacterium]
MRVGLLVPGGFLAGAALCAWMLRGAPESIAVDRAQPLTVVTYWHHFGAQMWLAFALAIVIASIGYLAALRGSSLRAVIALSALACAAALLFPVVFSSDVYAYAGYGDMALHGISPYAHARITVRDPLLDAMLWQWGNPPPMCVYGPAFVWLAQAIAAVFLPLGAAAPLWAFRVLACLALVACAPLAYAAFSPFPRATRLAAAAGIALNPIAIWSAAEGHNDTLALAIVLAGFALASRSRLFTGALLVALSALVKAPGAVAAVALAATSRRAAAGAALGIAMVAGLAIPLEYGVRAHLAPAGHYFPQFSLQYVSIPLAAVVVAALIAACFPKPGLRVTPVLALAGFLAIPNPYPWYAVWLLPVAFLAWESAGAWALIAASLLIAVRYYPDATTALSRPLNLTIVAVEFAVPLALMSAHIWNARRGRREIRTPVPGFARPRSP